MTDGSVDHATLEGDASLGAVVNLTDFYYQVNTISSPRIRLLGTVEPKRLLYAGIIGAYFLIGGQPSVAYWQKVEWNFDDSSAIAHGQLIGADHIFWKLPPGLDILIGWSF